MPLLKKKSLQSLFKNKSTANGSVIKSPIEPVQQGWRCDPQMWGICLWEMTEETMRVSEEENS